MPLTQEDIGRLLERDPDIEVVIQSGNVMGHYLEARLTDGRAVQIDFHDNPAWKDTDRLAGRVDPVRRIPDAPVLRLGDLHRPRPQAE